MTASRSKPFISKNKKPKRVLVFSHTANTYGGAEAALIETITYLTKTGCILPHFILPNEGNLSVGLTEVGISYTVIPSSPWCESFRLSSQQKHLRGLTNLEALKSIESLIKELKPEIALTNTIVSPWLAVASAKQQVPHIWMLHEFGNIDHGFIFDYNYSDILLTINRLSDAVIVNSKALANHVKSQIEPEKITQIYYAMADNKKPEIHKQVSAFQNKTSCKLLLLGRITRSKGQLEAVQALKLALDKGINVELLLIGEVEGEEYMREIKKEIDDPKLKGRVKHLDHQYNPKPYIQSADVLLMCSQNEAFGRVTVEGMLEGKPAIGTKSGGTIEIIKDGETGLLYEPGNINQLAEKIAYMANDEAKRQKMGQAAKTFVTESFNHHSSEDKIIDLLDSLVASINFPILDLFIDMAEEKSDRSKELEEELKRQNKQMVDMSKQHKELIQELEKAHKIINELTGSKAWKVARRLQSASQLVNNVRFNKKQS